MPEICVTYFAILREQRGCDHENIETAAPTPAELYEEQKSLHQFTVPLESLRVAINDEFASMDTTLQDGDVVAFISPVAGG